MSKVAFQHCSFHHIKFQYTGLNTNLFIQDTVVTYCTSADTNLPLFFMQTLYNYNASIFIKNVEFSHNKSPIIYATQFEEIFMDGTSFVMNGKDISNLSLVTISGSYITLKHSTFNHTLGTAIEIKNAKNFTGSNIVFLSNNGSVGSCLVVKRHSNVNLLHTVFRQNSNPVVYVKDKDDVKILLQVCLIIIFILHLLHHSFFETFLYQQAKVSMFLRLYIHLFKPSKQPLFLLYIYM